MELLLLDKNFEVCGIIDDFSSLVWNRKYYECGNFSLQTTANYLEQFKNAKYIYAKDFQETGVIETFHIVNTEQGTEILHTGRFLESKLAQRVIDNTQYFKNKTTEDIVCSLVNTFAINAEDRKIANLRLGERKGLGKVRTMQITGANLLEKIYELCKEDELSIKLWHDFDKKELVFEVWKGEDRTDTQNKNTWAIFSKNFQNILEETYQIDKTQYCNFAYVAGEEKEETKARTIITIDRRKNGEERKELYVDARDLQSEVHNEDGSYTKMSDEEYKQILMERGIEKLNENTKIETANFKIDPLSNLIYKQDFDIGDKVIYKNEDLEYSIENRIVEISEAYENGNKTIDVTFGEEFNLKKIRR